MARAAMRRVGLVLAGLIMGLIGLAFGIWFFLQFSRVQEVMTQVGEAVGEAFEGIERIEVLRNEEVRLTFRDVALFDSAGDTILAAPQLLLTLDAPTINGEGAIEFYDVEVRNPYGNLIQYPSGVWNVMQVAGATAGGQPIESEGRPLLFRDVRIVNGRLIVAMPYEPAPQTDSQFTVNLPATRIGGADYYRYLVTDFQAALPRVRVGGTEGWRAEVASMSGQLEEPRIRIANIEGWMEQAGEDGVSFNLAEMRFGESRLTGRGEIRFTDAGPLYDAEIQASPLRLADVRPLLPTFPVEGIASFALTLQSVTAERLAMTFRELDVTALDSRIMGTIGLAMGGDLPPAVTAADLELAPLDLAALEQLGFAPEMPVVGQVTGRVTSRGAQPGRASVDLRAAIVGRDDVDGPVSTVLATGEIQLGSAADALRLDGLVIGLQPLYLASLRSMVPPAQLDRMRGEVRGAITLAGTLREVRLVGGEMAYQVGAAAPTRLNEITGTIAMTPDLRYQLNAVAAPISLTTLVELFPALPLGGAALTGPIAISGGRGGFQLDADLGGGAGGIQLAAAVELGEFVHFDVQGSVRAFATGMILRPELPVQGPLTGTFSAQGTTQQFGFNVDLVQSDGSFAMSGSANLTAEPARFDVAGNVDNFRLGALLGQPQLFPGVMTGPIRFSGGGGDPYSFLVDLRGDSGRLDLTGVYRPTEIPSYEIRGSVVGLDLSALPLARKLPPSDLTGQVDIRGSGVDTETLEGTFSFDLNPSTISTVRLESALGRIEVANGIAEIDTLHFQVEESMFAASGSWGLRTPAQSPLRFVISSPDLGVLARIAPPAVLAPPQLAGSLEARGEVGGSFEFPTVAGEFHGRNFRFREMEAASFDADLDVTRDAAGIWSGEVVLAGTELNVPGLGNIQTLGLEASGTQSAFSIGLSARRDAESDLALAGVLQMNGLRPNEIALQTMMLRAQGATWELLAPTRMRYVGDEGLLIENLVLERAGTTPGRLSINGMVPPMGNADLNISAENLDLADLHRILPAAPALEGLLTLNAVLEGPVSNPELSLNARIAQLRYEGVLTESLTFDARYANRLLSGVAEGTAGGQRLFRGELGIPMTLSLENRLIPAFTLLREEPLRVTVNADSLPLGVVAAMVPGLAEGAGVARAQMEVGGTIDQPLLEGWVRVQDGALLIEQAAVRYSEIQADVAMAQSRAVINNISMRSGGTASARGTIDFPSGSSPVTDLTVSFSGFELMNNPDVAHLKVSGQLSVAGATSNAVATGNLLVYESTLRVPDRNTAAQPTLELAYADVGQPGGTGTTQGGTVITPPMLGNFTIDGIQLNVGESVYVESRDMRVQIDGSLVLYRTGEELRIFGGLNALRGTYSVQVSSIVREFDVIDGRVQFYGTGDINPSLDLRAGYRVPRSTVGSGGELTILVNVTGTLLAPRIQLGADTSVPLSEADLLSYLIFGRPSFELSAVTGGFGFAEQLLVQEVIGGILANELERAILPVGICDWVRVRPGATTNFSGLFGGTEVFSSALIECGVEVANSVFLTAQTGLGDTSFGEARVSVEWQIDDQWMWEATYGAIPRDPAYRILNQQVSTQFSTDLRRRWEYGRPQRRGILDLTPERETAVQVGPPLPPIPDAIPLPDTDPPPAPPQQP